MCVQYMYIHILYITYRLIPNKIKANYKAYYLDFLLVATYAHFYIYKYICDHIYICIYIYIDAYMTYHMMATSS
jgi:hypothetical protein